MKLLIVSILLLNCIGCEIVITTRKSIEKAITESAEHGYFKGQKDFMENDIRISYNVNGKIVWSASPWDNGKPPIYIPTEIDQ